MEIRYTLIPPTEQERIANEMSDGASEELTAVLTQVFGTFPSKN